MKFAEISESSPTGVEVRFAGAAVSSDAVEAAGSALSTSSPLSTNSAGSLYGAMSGSLGDLVEAIAGVDRVIAAAHAARTLMIDQARQWSEATESVSERAADGGWNTSVRAQRVLASSLACALRLPERSAERLIADSELLVHELPQTQQALSDGRVSWRHATAIVEHARTLPEESRAAFEAAVLPHAERLTVALLNKKARRVRELVHPEPVDVRHRLAAEERRVELDLCADGMAWLSLFLPAVQAKAAFDRIVDIADCEARDAARQACTVGSASRAASPGTSELTLTQRRADIAVELLTTGTAATGRDRGIRATLAITVPVLRLLGASDEPATLEGYGPIDTETALELAGTATSFVRILTHPETSAVLSVGRDRYRAPTDLRTFLRVSDETCRFPGCNRSAKRCELDHTVDWVHGGQTAHDNLAHLCPSHHHLKHQTGWRVRQLAGRTLEWTSPGGQTYLTHPAA